MLEQSLIQNGYTIINFSDLQYLYAIQDKVKSIFPCMPTEFHHSPCDDEQRLTLVKQAKDKIVQHNLIKEFMLVNADFLVQLLGPDIDIQSNAYLRVSRPNVEKDFVDWHRDTFYGNSLWELNFWIPVFPLLPGAGLLVVEGSHLIAARNVRPVVDEDDFRSQVVKGSLANELGYLYAPKTDDSIALSDANKIKLLTPDFGQGILFFSHVMHRAQNTSSETRLSLDFRIKKMFAPTNTKPGYYQPLLRSKLSKCMEMMTIISDEEMTLTQ